ncbi:hypothetical protein [Deinococcus sp. Leaf326]|uniref:hypothetical protein n=1 Tax=Deinococcus sp. Leaf326 TaxID=1736338 RepID=UPI000701A44B|nr:hypothetical protein [Deinococcus sp. Leaf326]KQR33122.1 hypothetical protein ASF71_16660 [Deinococcus sp. Leaf326]
MAPTKKTAAPTKPLTDAQKHQEVAKINARHQKGELSPEKAQEEIDLILEGQVVDRSADAEDTEASEQVTPANDPPTS